MPRPLAIRIWYQTIRRVLFLIVLAASFLRCAKPAAAQDPALVATRQAGPPFSHQAWSTDEGLPDASVHAILQSRDGYLWIATEGGAARFDGSEFTIFRQASTPAFPSDDITSLAQDSAGDLWFGTADGLVRRHGPAFQRLTEADGLPSAAILSLAATPGGALLALTSGGLATWDGIRFHPVAGAPPTPAVLRTESNTAISVLSANPPLLFTSGTLQPEASQQIAPLRYAHDGFAWAYSTQTLTLGAPFPPQTLHTGQQLPPGRITTVEPNQTGGLWIGTHRGLYLLHPGTPVSLQAIPALGNDVILSILVDREGNTWVGTEASGLHVLRPRKFQSLPATAEDDVTAVAALSSGEAWFGTRDSGLHHLERGTVSAPPIAADKLSSPVILSLALGSPHDLWAGTPDGLDHITNGQVQHFTSANGLPDDFIRSLLVDGRGTVWAGTRGGLVRIEKDHVSTFTTADGLGSDSIGPLLQLRPSTSSGISSADDLWVGTSDGLTHVQGDRLQNFRPFPSKGDGTITGLAQTGSQELLAAVHNAGLFFFSNGRFSPRALALPFDVSSLLVDGEGFLWMRGAHTVARVGLAQLRFCAAHGTSCAPAVNTFSVADGLPNNAATEGLPQLSLASDNTLWVATRKGLAVANLAFLPIDRVPPPVVVQRFDVDGADLPTDAGPLTISPGHSRFTFSFAALSYTLPAKVRYRYRLEGFDRDWVDAGTSRTAYYTSLPSRRYRFLVQAQNNDGVWDRSDAVIAFRILPPFYRRWWFAVLVPLAVALLVFLLIRLREQAVQRRFALVLQERNRLAREVHDTLAQDFVSVSLQLDIASSLLKANQVEQVAEQLQDMRTLVKEGLHAARQSIWNLRASAGEDSLPTRLSALIARFSFHGRPPRLTMGGAFRKLSPVVEAETLRIAQESLANVTRHADATDVEVVLFYGPEDLQLTVRDNGQGFAPADASKEGHYGLRGMRERSEALRAELMIASSPGGGTAVTLRVPLGKETQRT